MLHELKDIINTAISNQTKGLKSVLATVVYLDGSSYRKPGVRMLISEDNRLVGAVSGGCVEKEVLRRSQSVFKDGKAKVMTYDGRYRLGCEGILYILLEPFVINEEFETVFINLLKTRETFTLQSFFKKEDESIGNYGSKVELNNGECYSFSESFKPEIDEKIDVFIQSMLPCYRLLIIGAEHDAVKLCMAASLLGWEVEVVTSLKDPKQVEDFPGVKTVHVETPESIDLKIDDETAVILMTHNYVQDLKYLLKLEPLSPKYVGILGSAKRREQLQNELIHFAPELSETFLDKIHSPAGLNIGAITPEEIALSILSEILSVFRNNVPVPLKTITGKIHT